MTFLVVAMDEDGVIYLLHEFDEKTAPKDWVDTVRREALKRAPALKKQWELCHLTGSEMPLFVEFSGRVGP